MGICNGKVEGSKMKRTIVHICNHARIKTLKLCGCSYEEVGRYKFYKELPDIDLYFESEYDKIGEVYG